MRITFLLTQSLESPSGLGRYWPIAKELVRIGYQVTILALHPDLYSLSRRHFHRDGVEVRYVGQMHVRKTGNIKFYFNPMYLLWVATLATWQLAIAALQVPTDVYHVAKPHPMNGMAALLPRLLYGRLFYLDCDDHEAVSNRFSSQWQKHVVNFFEDQLPTRSAGITVNTRFTVQRLRGLGIASKYIHYVPNGVDRNRFSVLDQNRVDRLREGLGLTGCQIILYLGSMSLANHPVDMLLKAFAKVQYDVPRAILVLAGGGEDYNRLQRIAYSLGIDNKVRFVGRVKPENVPYYYQLGDISVDPVFDDDVARARSPLKLFESIALGTPVVTGDVGDRREILGDQAGVLVPAGNPEKLAQGLSAVLNDDAYRYRLSKGALRISRQYYWDILVKDWTRVYSNNPFLPENNYLKSGTLGGMES